MNPTTPSDSAVAGWLGRQYGTAGVFDAARALASEVRQPAGKSDTVLLRGALRARRIGEIRERAMPYLGRLRAMETGFLIEHAPADSRSRRSTIAHEIGHTFFYNLKEARPRRVRARDDIETEEAFCERFAAELLILDEWVSSCAPQETDHDDPLTLAQGISELAVRSHVGARTAAARVLGGVGSSDILVMGIRGRTSRRGGPSATCQAWQVEWIVGQDGLPVVDRGKLGRQPRIAIVPLLKTALLGGRPTNGSLQDLAPVVDEVLRLRPEQEATHPRPVAVVPLVSEPAELAWIALGGNEGQLAARREALTELLVTIGSDSTSG